jgi:hypothetical protein
MQTRSLLTAVGIGGKMQTRKPSVAGRKQAAVIDFHCLLASDNI